jgi:hypothetical protein
MVHLLLLFSAALLLLTLLLLPTCCSLSVLHREEAFAPLPQGASRTLVMGRLLEWPSNSRVPWVDVKESIGPASSLDVATEALIKSEQVLDKDFSMEVS